MLVRAIVIPVLAVAGVAMAVQTVRTANRPVVPAEPVTAPASSPFDIPVAGAGLVEASTQNIAIGTHVAGIVERVYVKAGDRVEAGAPLWSIDARSVRAELAVREAALGVARRSLARLEALPRPETVPPAEARVAEMEAMLADARAKLSMIESVPDRRAVSEEDTLIRRFAVGGAAARLEAARAELAELKAGAWAPELEIARAEVASAEAAVALVKTELDRLTVRAPVSGQVLQSNVRAGEFAPTGAMATPLMLLGEVETLHVRVDIDENDAWRFSPAARARASLRGNAALTTDLSFVRVEPYVIPKRSLTGESSERVDTRVLQVLYAFPRGALPVYVGQQMDVFIDATDTSARGPASTEKGS